MTCPRCGSLTDQPYFGPCEECRRRLNQTAEERRWWRWFLGWVTKRWKWDVDSHGRSTGKKVVTGGWA